MKERATRSMGKEKTEPEPKDANVHEDEVIDEILESVPKCRIPHDEPDEGSSSDDYRRNERRIRRLILACGDRPFTYLTSAYHTGLPLTFTFGYKCKPLHVMSPEAVFFPKNTLQNSVEFSCSSSTDSGSAYNTCPCPDTNDDVDEDDSEAHGFVTLSEKDVAAALLALKLPILDHESHVKPLRKRKARTTLLSNENEASIVNRDKLPSKKPKVRLRSHLQNTSEGNDKKKVRKTRSERNAAVKSISLLKKVQAGTKKDFTSSNESPPLSILETSRTVKCAEKLVDGTVRVLTKPILVKELKGQLSTSSKKIANDLDTDKQFAE